MCNFVIAQRYICGHARGAQDGMPASFHRGCTWRTRLFRSCLRRFEPTPTIESIPWLCPDCHWRTIQEALGPLHRQAVAAGEFVLKQSGLLPEGNDSMFIQSYQESLEGAVQQMETSVRLVAVSWHQYRERILREWLGAQGFENFATLSSDAARPWWDALQRGGTNDDPFRRLELSPEEELPDYRAASPTFTVANRPNWPLNNFGGSTNPGASQLNGHRGALSPHLGDNLPPTRGSHGQIIWANGPPPAVVAEVHPVNETRDLPRIRDTVPLVPPHVLASSDLGTRFQLSPGPSRRASTISYGTATPEPTEVGEVDEVDIDDMSDESSSENASNHSGEMYDGNGPHNNWNYPFGSRIRRRRGFIEFPPIRHSGHESSDPGNYSYPELSATPSTPDAEYVRAMQSLLITPQDSDNEQPRIHGNTNFSRPFPQMPTITPQPTILPELSQSPRPLSASSSSTAGQSRTSCESDGSEIFRGLGDFWLNVVEDSEGKDKSNSNSRESNCSATDIDDETESVDSEGGTVVVSDVVAQFPMPPKDERGS